MNNSTVAGLVLAAGLAGSFIGRSCGLEQQVKNICERYASRRNITFSLESDGVSTRIPELFSKYEHFIPQNVENSYLAGKVGFDYEQDLRRSVDGKEGLFPIGTLLSYNIRDYSGKPSEQFVISNYDDSNIFPKQRIFMIVLEGKLDYLEIKDESNHTGVSISRREKGLQFNPSEINQAAAQQLWGLYSSLFLEFKQKNAIDAKVAAFTPQLEVQHTLP